MQQVGKQALLATATVVDPRYLPALRPSRSRALVLAGRRTWVLHKRLWLRLILGGIVLFVLLGAYVSRDHIVSGAIAVGEFAKGEFASAGFGIRRIMLSGQTLTSEADMVQAMGLDSSTSTLSFDPEAARLAIEKMPAVASATVRKIFPGTIEIAVTEKVPVARWRVDGVTFVVDALGEQIGEDSGAYADLPLIIGDGAADDAIAIIRSMDSYQSLHKGLAAYSRIGDRRWDLIYDTGLRVQLPEMGVGPALSQLQTLNERYALLDRDVTLIDLRVPGLLALRPAKTEEEDKD